MKRILAVLLAVIVLAAGMSMYAYADAAELQGMNNQQLLELYEAVREEMSARGLAATKELQDGKYIIGQEILPGVYTITCTGTEAEDVGSAYSSLGDAYGALLGDEWGSLMGSLGGAMSTLSGVTVRVLGDYGTVLKEVEMKTGESTVLTLSEGTALEISEGSVTIEAN